MAIIRFKTDARLSDLPDFILSEGKIDTENGKVWLCYQLPSPMDEESIANNLRATKGTIVDGKKD